MTGERGCLYNPSGTNSSKTKQILKQKDHTTIQLLMDKSHRAARHLGDHFQKLLPPQQEKIFCGFIE